MLNNILPLFLVALAAFFNSIMDTLDHHYSSSIFSDMPKWWSNNWQDKQKLKSWRFILEPFFDAWHTSKTLFLITCTIYPTVLLMQIYKWDYDFNYNPLLINPLMLMPLSMVVWYWVWNWFTMLWRK